MGNCLSGTMSAGALAHEGGSFGSAGFKAYTGDRVRGTNVLEGNVAVLVLVVAPELPA